MSNPLFPGKLKKMCLDNKQKTISNFAAKIVCLFTCNILSLTMVFKCETIYELII